MIRKSTPENQTAEKQLSTKKLEFIPFLIGVGITLLLAIAAKYVALLPPLGIIGPLVIAILLGMVWRSMLLVPKSAADGIAFSSKKLLRVGIILLGMRLNLQDIVHAGPKVFAIAAFDIVFALLVVYGLCRWLKVDQKLGMLTACGTAICGAAAIAAIAPQVKANNKETAVGVAIVAVLGTLFTLAYTLLYPMLGLTPSGYGVFSGATLHEIAHVLAAAGPGGQEALNTALLVKLTRVALLVPVAILVGWWFQRQEMKKENDGDAKKAPLPIPWFIFGFVFMSGVTTLNIIPEAISEQMVAAAYLLIAMAMAGLGLNIELRTFRRTGGRPFVAGFIGSVLLSFFGLALVHLLGIA